MSLKLYTYQAVRRLDQLAIAAGHTSASLMASAGKSAWEVLRQTWPDARHIAIMCGAGNNGGDGYILAQHALAAGCQVSLYAIEPHDNRTSLEAQSARAEYLKQGGLVLEGCPSSEFSNETVDIIVDAILGTGVRQPLKPLWSEVIHWINVQNRPILSIDVPSGLMEQVETEGVGVVQATVTVTFMAQKVAFFLGHGFDATGQLVLSELGVPESIREQVAPVAMALTDAVDSMVRSYLPKRRREVHKGDFGHVVVLGGLSPGLEGAGLLASEAALRGGAGWVSLVTRRGAAVACPELMVHIEPDELVLEGLFRRATVLVVGPGLGQRAAATLCQRAIATQKPLVLDADGLNWLAVSNIVKQNHWILTPHPGEAARLLNTTVEQVQRDRLASAHALAEKFGGVVILKGAGTLIVDGAHDPVICPKAVPAMASAGMGDVLSGLLGALLAQGLSAWEAACLGVMVHAEAAEQTQLMRGVLASDLFPNFVKLLNQ